MSRLRRRDAGAPALAGASAPAPSPSTRPALDDWRQILAELGAERPAVASVFEHGAPLELRPGRILLGYEPGSFLVDRAAEPGALAQLAAIATAHFGEPTVVELDTSGRHQSVVTLAAMHAEERAERLETARKAVAERPLVRAALRVLGAELREIRFPEPTR